MDALLARHGLRMTAKEFRTRESQRYLAYFPRRFQYRAETFDDRYSFVGPRVGPRPNGPPWTPPADDRPVVLVTLGTINNNRPSFYRSCFTAFADSPWHVVLAVGERIDLSTLGPPPPNVEVAPVVPQLTVLARAAVLVSHAGMGGVMEALWAGVPHLAVPQTPEQDANATRLAELGLGERLPPGAVTAPVLREAVDRVARDADMAERIRQMRDELAAAGGAPRAADLIEDLLHPSRS